MGISRYWVSHITADFSSIYWSATSGGPTGASVPNSSSHIYYDSNGPGNCVCSNTVSVLGLTTTPGFVGNIVQQSYPFTVGLEDASFAGGRFIGGTSEINIAGNFYLTGADFTSTKSNLIIQKNFYCNDGIHFFHNDGSVSSYASDKIFDPHGASFSNLILNQNSLTTDHQILDSTCYVENKLVLNGGYLRFGSDGTMYAMRDVECNSGFGRMLPEHNGIISFYGPNKQSFFSNGGILPYLFVNKNDCPRQVKAHGDSPILINGDFLIFDGTFNTNGLNIYQGQMIQLSDSTLHADFTWAVIHEIPRLVSFFDLSTGEPLDWNWDLGDGTDSFIQDFVHNYAGYETVYPVTLRVANSRGPDTTTINIRTLPKYTNFYADQTEVTSYFRQPVNYLVSSSNNIYSSHDGTSWVLRYRNLSSAPNGFCTDTSKNIWIAGNTEPVYPIFRSVDGVTWQPIDVYTGESYSPAGFLNPVFGNNIFLVNDNNRIYRSIDGIGWTLSDYFSTQVFIDYPDLIGGVTLTDVVFGNRSFVILDELNNISWVTTDGSSFIRGGPFQGVSNNLSFGRGLFVKGGFYSSDNYLVWISSDGSAWSGHKYHSGLTVDTPMRVDKIVYGYDGTMGIDSFLAQYSVYSNYTFYDNTTATYTIASQDASTWYTKSTNTLQFTGVAFHKGNSNDSLFIGVGTDGTTDSNVFTTIDGSLWAKQTITLPTAHTMQGVWADSTPVNNRPTYTEEHFTVTSQDILNGGLLLSYRVIGPVAVNIVNAASQNQGIDFEVFEAFVKWDGYALENFIAVGDVVRVIYNASVIVF